MVMRQYWCNPRLLAILMLGFASGLPLALVGSTLQAWFTESQIGVVAIGFLSLAGLPYSFKFLWAPVMDYLNVPMLGRRRGFIAITLGLLILALLLLANLNPVSHTMWMAAAALLVAFFSASLDISITAYQTDILKSEERGLGVACYVFTYRVAILVSGGLALVLAAYVGFKVTYYIMAFMLFLCALWSLWIPSPPSFQSTDSFYMTVKVAIKDLVSRDKIALILLFILFYKFGDALALQLMTNFLLHGLHFSLADVGLAYKSMSFIATVLGVFVGGFTLSRIPIFSGLLWFGFLQAFSNLMFVLLAWVGKNLGVMMASIFIENFCSGLSTAALLAFLMSLCNHRFTATQYAIFSAIASFPRIALGPVAGWLVQHLGWIEFYSWAFVLSFPGIVFLSLLKAEVRSYAITTVD